MDKHTWLLELCGVVGIIFSSLLKVKSMKQQTKELKTTISYYSFIQDEWVNFVIGFLFTSVLCLSSGKILSNLSEHTAKFINNWDTIIAIPLGYMSTDIALRFFGVTQKVINKEVDNLVNKIPDLPKD